MIGTVTPKEFKKLVESWEYIVIDIRTPEELEHFWIIPGMNLHLDFYTQIDDILSLDKSKKYLIYCYHGNRTGVLLEYMKMHGFENVIDLGWWTQAWVDEWFQLVKK